MDFVKSLNFFKKRNITVFAFHGPSGTGKSYHAKLVAQKFKTKTLIDDGLLIQDEKIIAGKSAKLEKSYMGAVRVALFDDKEHRDSVAKAIHSHHIKRILILGTSEKMILKITTRLQLPEPVKFITIQEVATPEEMEEARRSRQIEGKHVIPVRSHEVKGQKYSKIFVNSIKIAFSKKKFLAKFFGLLPIDVPLQNEMVEKSKKFEKSIVRPAFSISARKQISHAAITRMTVKYSREFDAEVKIKKLSIKNGNSGYNLTMTVDIPFRKQLAEVVQSAKDFIIKNIEKESGILIEELFIIIDKIIQPKKVG